jgi:NAD(P)-dependent dehydrogenase (short-subunit alcohol dehydrogenase family)
MGRSCEGRVALVTGASAGGTGTAIAVRLAAEGAAVAITARTREGLERTCGQVEEVGGTCLVLPADLADPDGERGNLVARTEAELGPLDIVVNNAAASGYKPFEVWTPEELAFAQQVNVWAPWQLMARVVGGMRERGRGWILNLTTFSAELPPGPPYPDTRPATGGSAYGSTKAALNRLTIAVAAETAGQGIAVNALTPQAAISTPRLVAAGWIDERLFEPLDTMAEAALALCTGDPSVLTGRIAYSLQFLLEQRRAVHDLRGEHLVEGWQPDDLPARIARQVEYQTAHGWPDPYDFHRPSSPAP